MKLSTVFNRIGATFSGLFLGFFTGFVVNLALFNTFLTSRLYVAGIPLIVAIPLTILSNVYLIPLSLALGLSLNPGAGAIAGAMGKLEGGKNFLRDMLLENIDTIKGHHLEKSVDRTRKAFEKINNKLDNLPTSKMAQQEKLTIIGKLASKFYKAFQPIKFFSIKEHNSTRLYTILHKIKCLEEEITSLTAKFITTTDNIYSKLLETEQSNFMNKYNNHLPILQLTLLTNIQQKLKPEAIDSIPEGNITNLKAIPPESPFYNDAQYLLAEFFYQKQKYAQANTYLQKIIPDSILHPNTFASARIFLDKKEPDSAIDILKNAYTTNNEQKAQAVINILRAEAYLMKKMPEEAIKFLDPTVSEKFDYLTYKQFLIIKDCLYFYKKHEVETESKQLSISAKGKIIQFLNKIPKNHTNYSEACLILANFFLDFTYNGPDGTIPILSLIQKLEDIPKTDKSNKDIQQVLDEILFKAAKYYTPELAIFMLKKVSKESKDYAESQFQLGYLMFKTPSKNETDNEKQQRLFSAYNYLKDSTVDGKPIAESDHASLLTDIHQELQRLICSKDTTTKDNYDQDKLRQQVSASNLPHLGIFATNGEKLELSRSEETEEVEESHTQTYSQTLEH